MAHRIEVLSKITDSRAAAIKSKLESFNFQVDKLLHLDVYTLNKKLNKSDLAKSVDLLTNPVIEDALVDTSADIKGYDWAIEIGFLPGVTDNVASTVKEEIQDLLKTKFDTQEGVYSSQLIFVKGKFDESTVSEMALVLYNPLIQRAQIKSSSKYAKDGGMGVTLPIVHLAEGDKVTLVDLDVSDEELTKIGKQGIANSDGSRRGPLALDLASMRVIRDYFKTQKRKPSDIELESLAQTWSEHCKHTIFAAHFDDIKDGLYKGYIKRATQEIRQKKGKDDICVSVFTDNSGAIIFDDNYLITDKVETHNSPSALDPFGGAITGIVGVNRDTVGFGKAAKPVMNRFGFCFADPRDERPLYKAAGKQQKMLSPRKIMDGVIDGVNVGGNCSGIPTPQGFVYFDENFRGKPLIFVGTIGLIPKKINGENSWEKQALVDDLIVVIGGRVGADGIHGATFSSEAMDSGSPATAVQIGDPITQKKFSDAIVKEARDLGLYSSITDNGAGGISCSVAEMAKESGGCIVELDKVPLKYPGLSPWETWISESQERMTLSVPSDKWQEFKGLMDRRGVESTIIGKFNDSGKCVVNYNGKTIMDIDMHFLHEGLPEKTIKSVKKTQKFDEPKVACPQDLNETLCNMLTRLNIGGFEFISKQYDHEVQGGSVIKPLVGSGRVNGNASVTRPLLHSKKGVVLSQALYPTYSEINTYDMAACSIDTAIRNAISVGGDLDSLALLDNFCWCSSDEPERLAQLKEAVQACYDYSTEYETPFISGKDSMFNDFVGYDENEKPIKISVPPTLLVSSIGVVADSEKAVDMATKMAGDLVYLVGDTSEELGGSEYFAYLGEKSRGERFFGNCAPKVDAKKAVVTYRKVSAAIKSGLVASAISVEHGGLGPALAKSAIASGLGMDLDLSNVASELRDDYALFSESQSRLVISINPADKQKFESIMNGTTLTPVGSVTNNGEFVIKRHGKQIVKVPIDKLENCYKETLRDY
jgi:phosphoribosylformylglycinamidine synthase